VLHKLCCFCIVEESIKHIFFECVYARFVYMVVHIVFRTVPPLNTDNLFNNWIKQGRQKPNINLLTWQLYFGQFG
jgi:hypothetical protein